MRDERGACLQTLEGHSGVVSSVAFSHDSTRLASASSDKTVKIWDTSSGECLQPLEGHSGEVNSVAFSHDSTWLVSASYNTTVKIWDTSSGACLQTLEGHSNEVKSVAFSQDSTRLVSASYDKKVKIRDASNGECLQTLKGHSQRVTSVVFSQNSTLLVSASYDKKVKIWDASNGECLQTLGTGEVFFDMSSDATGSHLCTEAGTIAFDTTSAFNSGSPDLLYQGGALSSDGAWITYNSKNIVWLPSEYRPGCWAVSGKTIGIGAESGKVWICNIEVDDSDIASGGINLGLEQGELGADFTALGDSTHMH